jgi:hypothetical protein
VAEKLKLTEHAKKTCLPILDIPRNILVVASKQGLQLLFKMNASDPGRID